MWDLIVSVPDHCLSFYFIMLMFQNKIDIIKAVRESHNQPLQSDNVNVSEQD